MKQKWNRGAVLVTILLAAMGPVRSQQKATRTERFPQFENEDVKVWKSVVMPDTPLTMHRHEHGRVIIALRGGRLRTNSLDIHIRSSITVVEEL